MDNKFKERRTPEAAGVGNRYVTRPDVFESDMFNVRAFTETRINDQTLLTSGYSYTRMDTDNVGITRKFSKAVRGSLSYGFFRHRDETSGGFDNYDAHLVFSTITYRF